MNVYTAGLLVSIFVYLAVGNYAGRRVKRLEDYFVAGRQAPTLLIVGTLVASLISTNAFMGEAGRAYAGFPTVIIMLTAINCIGYVAGGLYFGRFLRRSRALTVAEYFGQRFNSRRVQAVAGLTTIVVCTGYLMTVTQGTATIVHEVTGLPFAATLIIVWAGYTLFTLYSGSQGVVLTDTLMFLLFAAVIFMGLAFIVGEAGGWFQAISDLASFERRPGIISWHGSVGPESDWRTPADALIYSIILGFAWGIVVAVSPWQASRYLMARDEHTVIRSTAITAGVIMALYVVLAFAAAAINLINPEVSPAQESMIWASLNIMPTTAGVLMMSGILAAGLSSASTFLSLVSFSISNDLRKPASDDDQQRLKSSRRAMLVTSLVALALAYLAPQGLLFWIVYFFGTLLASSWGPVAFMSIWSRRITESAAFWGIITGALGNISVTLVDAFSAVDLPEIANPILVGVILSYLTIEVVSRFGEVHSDEHSYRERLHLTPEPEFEPQRLHRTLMWSWILVLSGIVTAVLMIVVYALPYGRAIGDVARGEILLAAGIGGCLVLAGLLAVRGTRRYYMRSPGRDG